MLGDPATAVAAYEHVVGSAPDDWQSWNNLGNARNAVDDVAGGLEALERAVELNPDAALARLNLARTYRHSGRFDEAEAVLRRMADDFPEDAAPLIDLHDLLKIQGRDDREVLAILDRALGRDPENVQLRNARGRQLALMLEMEGAELAFRAALAQEPTNADAFVGLATVYEHSRVSALSDLAAEAERNGVEPGALNLVRAFAHRRANRHAQGVAAIEKVPADFESARREHLRGQMLEGLGDYDGAFAAFERMNQVQWEDTSDPLGRAASLRSRLRHQLERTTCAWIGGWKTPPIEPERPAPVFLVGFPRSGTTLLDTLLMGHPDVDVMEERPVVHRVEGELGGFDRIPDLDESEIRQAQCRYFEIAAEYADVGRGALLVDKSPLLLNYVPTIYRLFPRARFILTLRHPADVILSCFVSAFRPNTSMANFLRLDTAAEFYDLTFRTWENSRALLPIEVQTIVYERLVADPETELRSLSDGLGLPWREEMLDHTKTAAGRGVITTASYAQVTEPIYQSSVGRWERYRNHLEPILPTLAPWAERFGYRI
jgi:tetratricopeptide (TPR) repeat protein